MNKPLIFDFMVNRNEIDNHVNYYYDNESNLNIVNTKNGSMPFVAMKEDSISEVLNLSTLTEVNPECVDEDCFLFESETETRVMRESSDMDTLNLFRL